MEIIIEYAFIDNMVMNLLIIFLSTVTIKHQVKKLRALIASLFGTCTAILLPIFSLPALALIVVKFFIGAIIILLAFKTSRFKMFILQYIVFFTYTAVLGGLSFAILLLFGGEILSIGELIYSFPLPIGFVYIILCAYIYLLFSAIKYFYKKRKAQQFIFKVSIFYKDKKIKTDAYLDSGNALVDPVTNQPVLILGYKTFSKIFSELSIEKVLMKKINQNDIKEFRYIKYSTISNITNEMLVFPIDKIQLEIDNQKKILEKIIGGLSFSKFQKSFNCDVILSPLCF